MYLAIILTYTWLLTKKKKRKIETLNKIVLFFTNCSVFFFLLLSSFYLLQKRKNPLSILCFSMKHKTDTYEKESLRIYSSDVIYLYLKIDSKQYSLKWPIGCLGWRLLVVFPVPAPKSTGTLGQILVLILLLL